jgi:hypothetical protein
VPWRPCCLQCWLPLWLKEACSASLVFVTYVISYFFCVSCDVCTYVLSLSLSLSSLSVSLSYDTTPSSEARVHLRHTVPRPTKSHSLRSSHVAARAQDAERLPASLPKVIGHRGAKVRASLLTGYICVLILHVSSCSYVCVLILLHFCVLILLYMCPHTTILSRR